MLGFGKPNIAKLKKNKEVEKLIQALYYEKDYEIPNLAVQVLVEIGDFKIVERIRQLIQGKSYTDQNKFYINSNSVRTRMVEVVGAIGKKIKNDSFAEKLTCVWTVECVFEIDDIRLQKSAADALGEIGYDSAVDSLLKTLNRGWSFTESFIEKLKQPKDKVDKMMSDFTIAAFTVQSRGLITAVVNALVKIGDCKAYPNLKSLHDGFRAYKLLCKEKNPWQGTYKDSVEKGDKELEVALENALLKLNEKK